MYHYVREIKDSRYPEIKGLELNQFIEQVTFFNNHYQIVSMEDVIRHKEGKIALPHNALLLTFDDGYAEHFNHVYPVLKEMGIQGSFFVPAKAILEHTLLDVNKIHFILASLANTADILQDLKFDIEKNKLKHQLKSFDEYYAELAVANRFDNKDIIFIKRILQHALPEVVRNELSSKYFEKYVGIAERTFAKELYMNTWQLKQMVRDGMHIGCHGYDHYWWDKLDNGALHAEISKSKDFLQSLGCDMTNWTACYPYGSSSQDVIDELEKQGCKLAFTTEVDIVDIETASPFLLPRLDTNDFPPKSQNYKQHG
ncbi:polysaccharide deacetylase [Photobacterium jeanii]|nr:polysaccharide deacetylase [Photobacterium jeanii]